MIGMPRKYQASLFCDMENLRPSVETIPPLLQAFLDRNLLPSTYYELALVPQGPPKNVPRLRFASSDNEWTVEFETVRINIEKNSIKPSGENLGNVEDFARDALDLLQRITRIFPKNGTRLALVTTSVLSEVSAEKSRDFFSRLILPTTFHQENPVLTWALHLHAKLDREIAGHLEVINVLTQVNRAIGQILEGETIIPFDGIQIQLDVNTIAENTQPRFDFETAHAFFMEALAIRRQALDSLRGQLNV